MLNVALRDEKENPGGLRKVADVLVKEAHKGEAWAIKEIADRLDGKPATVVSGDDENPIKHEALVIITGVPRKGDADDQD